MHFHGQIVTIIRPATPDDQGFKPGLEQCLVRMANGEHTVAPADEVTEDPTVDELHQMKALPMLAPKLVVPPKPKAKVVVKAKARAGKRR